MDTMICLIIILFLAVVVLFSLVLVQANKKVDRLKKYMDVKIGMPEMEMIYIMGDGFARSSLKNNRTKYEWRINGTSYGTSVKGFSFRQYSGVKKVTIYTKDGFVEEIKPYNV